MILATGEITLTNYNGTYTVSLSPSACNLYETEEGIDLSNAKTTITLYRGSKMVRPHTQIIARANKGLIATLSTDNPYTQELAITKLPDNFTTGTIILTVTSDDRDFQTQVSFDINVFREPQRYTWLDDWNTNKTQIGDEYFISPKIFSGQKDADGKLTGIYIGPTDINFPDQGYGLYGKLHDEEIFAIDSKGAFIGGWNFDEEAIYCGTKVLEGYTDTPNDITISPKGLRGHLWQLNMDGSGELADGNIKWNSTGDLDVVASNVSVIADNFKIKSSDGSDYVNFFNQGQISSKFINLNPLKLTSEKIPTIAELRGFSYEEIAVYDSNNFNGPKSILPGKSDTVISKTSFSLPAVTWTTCIADGYVVFSAESIVKRQGDGKSELISEDVFIVANSQKFRAEKIEGTTNYRFDMQLLKPLMVCFLSLTIQIESTYKNIATDSFNDQGIANTIAVTHKISGIDGTNKFRYYGVQKPSQQTIVGGNGFTSVGDEFIVHMQSDDQDYNGISQPAGITLLAGEYGINISKTGITQTSNGGITWN